MFELKIEGSGGAVHTIKRGDDGVVYCSCPAWRFQRKPAAERRCKHFEMAIAKLEQQLAKN